MTKHRKMFNCFNAKRSNGEENGKPSKTIKGESDTIGELIKKMAAGIVEPQKEGHYLDAELGSIDKYYGKNLDLTDLEELEIRTEKLKKTLSEQIQIQKDEELLEQEIETTQEEQTTVPEKPKQEEFEGSTYKP